jgi:TolB-like protein
LLSKHVAEDLEEYEKWRPLLHDLGSCEVKHGVRVSVVNLYADQFGNAKLPRKFETLRKRRTRVRWAEVVVVLLVLAAIIAGITMFSGYRARLARLVPEKSIAVLPFENRSEDNANAYFADGIQDEILTRLAKIADLKVISRTSTQRYQSKPGNLSEIAKQLGVGNILEGSVQRVGDQVRVNVQLVNAQSDSHLWAETYDRKLTDILGVESEIAKGIAESLQAKLTGREEQALAVQPTSSPEAYDAYLRGLASEARYYSSGFPTDLEKKAISFFERAVQLDPNFALAWARLSRANADLYYFQIEPNPAAWRDAAKRALENAQKLESNSPETLLALGYYQFWVLPGPNIVLGDYGAAKRTFRRVGEMLPNSSEVPNALALIARREGHWEESIAYFEQALALDPRNVELLNGAAMTYTWFRQFPVALKLWDRVLDITPNDPNMVAAKACIFQAQGNLPEAAKLLAGINEQIPNELAFETKIDQLRLERNYGEAIRLLKARQVQFQYHSQFDKATDQVWLALIQRLSGDTTGAKVTAEQARNTFDRLYSDQPNNFFGPAWLSDAYALMGEKDLALKLAERAVMMSRGKTTVRGPAMEENLAFIQTIFGESARAISTLTQLLQTPYESWICPSNVTPALLKLDPIWDPLRSDPAFQKLCEEKQP